MGARTDFVRAMLFGIVIGVATTTAFFQLRSTSCPPTSPPAAPKRVTIEPMDTPANTPTIDATARVDVPDVPVRKHHLIEQLAKAGIAVDDARVTCEPRCCRVSVDEATYDEHAEGIKSALSITPGSSWQAYKAGTVRVLEKCW